MAPCQWWDGLRKKSGSFCSFERQLLVFTLLESGPSKWACSGGKYCCLGALMGVPGVPVGWYIAPRQGWDRLRKKMVHLAVFSQNYWSLSSQKVAEENRLVLGMIFVVWGLPGGSPGLQGGVPRVPSGQYMAPRQCWDGLREKSGSFGSFEGDLLVFTQVTEVCNLITSQKVKKLCQVKNIKVGSFLYSNINYNCIKPYYS